MNSIYLDFHLQSKYIPTNATGRDATGIKRVSYESPEGPLDLQGVE